MRIVKLFVPGGIRLQERGKLTSSYLEEGNGVSMESDAIGVHITHPEGAFFVPWGAVQTVKVERPASVGVLAEPIRVSEPTSFAKKGKR